MNPQDKDFKKLKETWYKKLEKSGFEDLENDDGQLLNHVSSIPTRVRFNIDEFKAKEDYYRLAGQFLHDYTGFTSQTKKIWEMHQSGVSIRNIAKKIKVFKKSAINNIIEDLAKIMLKKYQVTNE